MRWFLKVITEIVLVFAITLGNSVCDGIYLKLGMYARTFEFNIVESPNTASHLFNVKFIRWNDSTCENIPEEVTSFTQEAKTDGCVILYSEKDCRGSEYVLLPGYHHFLFSFEDRAASFQTCTNKSTGLLTHFTPQITFYNDQYGVDKTTMAIPFDKIPASCQNLHRKVASKIYAVQTTKCVLLFSEENCKGDSERVEAGLKKRFYQEMGSFYGKTKSFAPCSREGVSSKLEYRIRFYENRDFTGIVDDVGVEPGCNNKFVLWNDVASFNSSTCVKAFPTYDCTGEDYAVIGPGQISSTTEEPVFKFYSVKSLQPCNELYSAGPSKDRMEYDVEFYTKTNFESWSFNYHRISTTCQNVHWHYIKQAESLTTKKCLYLFEKSNCEGTRYRVHPGNHSSLHEFSNKMISFKACFKYDEQIEHHAKFYANGNYTTLLDDVNVYDGCNKIDLRASFASVEAPVCLELFSGDSCSEGHSFILEPGRHSVLPSKIQSLRLCNYTTSLPGNHSQAGLNTNGFKLKAVITSFKVTSDENSVRQMTTTSLGEMGQRTVFRNDGPAVQTQRYSTQKTISDRVDLEMVKGLSAMSEVSVSDTATKDFTSGFRSTLNVGFTEKNSFGSSQSFTAGMESGISGTVYASTTATAEVSAGIASASASATAGVSTTAHLNAHFSGTSESHQEYSSERSAFQTEEKNVEERIGAALTSGYRNTGEKSSSTAERKSKEESRTFSIDQTITVNPCTEYEVTSFVKKTENFPAIYTTFANITGTYNHDGSAVPVEEIKIKLSDLELEFIENLDNQTVLAEGSAKLTLDFSWYSVWNWKGNLIEGCHDGTDSHLRYRTIAFYERPYLKSSLFRTKLTGSCQLLPYNALNKVQSVDVAACVILFPTESCKLVDERNQNVGYSLLLKPNAGRTLPYFGNVSRSFQSCEGYSALNLNTGRVQFYSEENKDGEPLLDEMLTDSCKDLPHSAKGNVLSVAAWSCIILFSKPQCQGSNFTVRPFSAMKLKDFFQGVTSFKRCQSIPAQSNTAPLGSIKLFEDKSKTNLLLDSAVRNNCVNLRSQIWNKTAALIAETCVILFEHPFCQGASILIKEGDDLRDFNLKSFIACNYENGSEMDNGNDMFDQGQACSPQIFKHLQQQNKEKEKLLEEICTSDGGHPLCSTFSLTR